MSKKSHKALASATVMSLILTSTLTATVSAATTGVERLSGSNRETTAIDVATKVFEKAETVVLVNGYKSADALSATPLAKAYNAPILSVNSVDEPSAALLAALSNLGAKKVVVVGGEGAVTKALATKLAGTYTVERIEGKDRYATNLAVAEKVKELKASKEAFVVNGTDASYADALSIASIAASKGAPLVFTNGKTISEEAKALVKDLKVTAIGGTGVVSADVLAAVDATRVGGADRFATNLEVLKAYKDVIKLDNVFVAYGLNFADALVASAAAAKTDAPVVLADKTNTKFTEGATDYIEANKAAIKNVYLVGGTGVIADSVKNAINSIVNPNVQNKDLAVESLKVANLRQIKVEFNKEVDKDSLSGLAVVASGTETGPGPLTVKLSDDKLTATITTTNTLDKKGYYNVTIKGVKDLEGKTITPDVKVVRIIDDVKPAINKIDAVTKEVDTRTFTVKFTEPVQFDLVKVGDKIVSAIPTSALNDEYSITVNSSDDALETGKAYTLNVSGLRDLAGNFADTTISTSFTVIRDNVKPTFRVVALNPKQFDVIFDKEMKDSVAVDSIVVKDSDGKILSQNGLATRRDDKKTFRVTLLNTPIASDKSSANVKVTVKNLNDTYGNAVSSKTEEIALYKESVKPQMTSLRLIPDTKNQVEVTFSETVSDIQGTDFAITDSKGDDFAATITASSTVTDNNNKVTLTLSNPLSKTDTYTVALKVDSVIDSSDNKNLAQTLKLSYTGESAAQVVATIDDSTTATDNLKIVVKFDKADVVNGIDNKTGNYKDGAADNATNFTIGGKALPKGTKVTWGNAGSGVNDFVTLDFTEVDADDLPTELKEGGNIVVTASNVKTEAGSTIQYTSKNITVVDKTQPTMKSAYLTGDATNGYKLVVIFSEKMNAVDPADFKLAEDDTKVAILAATASVDTDDAKKFTIEVTNLNGAALGKLKLSTIATPAATKDKATSANFLKGDTTGISVINYAQ